MSNPIKRTLEDAADAVKETLHRSNAEGEKVKRDLAGDEMTIGDKAKSVANQAKETVQAEYDRTKRKARDASGA